LRVVHKREGRVVAESAGSVTVPFAREHRALPTNRAALSALSKLTGGVVDAEPAKIFDPGDEHTRAEQPLWAFCLWLAAFVLVLDVAVRRDR
jgi:hypothetical protein